MRIWVTRASPGADRTAERLRDLGHSPLVSPVMRVKPLPAAVEVDDVAALAFSSANGVEAFITRTPRRDLPVFAVGDATAEAARQAGFASVVSAAGDVKALGRTIAEAGLPKGSVVLHPGGRDLAGDLPAEAGPGVVVRQVALYETVARAPSEALAVLDHDGLDAVLVHSSKAARRIAAVCAPWREGRAWYLCLSDAVAAPLRQARFEKVRAAPFPDEPALLKLLAELPSEPARMIEMDVQDASRPPDAEAPEPHAPPGARPRRPINRKAWGLLGILGAGLLAAVLVAAFLPGAVRRQAPETRPAAIGESQAESPEVLRARIAELETALAAAEGRALQASPYGFATADAGAINARLDRLERAQQRSARAASAAVAAAALADAAATSRPFVAEVVTLERLSPGSEALAGLRPLAETGAPTRAALAAEFPDVAARAAAASRAAAPNAGVLARLGAALASLVTVRRVDDVTGASSDAILARAERRVADGDIEGALQQLGTLPEGGREATAAWRERAGRRLEIERRIAALRTGALRDLAGSQEETTP